MVTVDNFYIGNKKNRSKCSGCLRLVPSKSPKTSDSVEDAIRLVEPIEDFAAFFKKASIKLELDHGYGLLPPLSISTIKDLTEKGGLLYWLAKPTGSSERGDCVSSGGFDTTKCEKIPRAS